MSTEATIAGLDPDGAYPMTLTGQQVELVRRHLINARTFSRALFASNDPHPTHAAAMRQEWAQIEAVLDILPVGEINPEATP